MPRSDSAGEDNVFFDACNDIRSSKEASSSVDCSTSDEISASWRPDYELWASEPMSVNERRQRFLMGMGFVQPIPTGMVLPHWQGEITEDSQFHDVEDTIASICSSFRSCSSDNLLAPDSANVIRDLNTGKRFVVHEGQHDGLSGIVEEVGSDIVLSSNEVDGLLGSSGIVQKFLRKRHGHSHASDADVSFSSKQIDLKSLLGSITRKNVPSRIFMHDVHSKSLERSTLSRTIVHQHNKKWMDFSAVYMCQEFQAHKGLIRVMKFSSSGWYLASGGDDRVVRIWQVKEIEPSPGMYGRETPLGYMNKTKVLKKKLGKGPRRALAIIPKKVFSIIEAPLHEFHGHRSEILDMSWSKLDFLLTSSKDKTVRMWKVGCDGCLTVFKHGAYVPCVQFNPVNERYFISGSIDGKVRVWDVSEERVTHWDDTRDIITAMSYQPDGKGFVVGSIAGKFRFYDQSDQNIQLKKLMRRIKARKRSAVNKITNLQFSKGDSSRIIITSADSKIRVSEGAGINFKKKGAGIVQKFEGHRGSKALLPPSLTPDGRYLVSAGMDSNVHIWSFDAKGKKPVRSREVFLSDGVTAVAPWAAGAYAGGEGEGRRRSTVSGHAAPTLCHDRECCSFGTWFLADGLRGSATWPEEKLLPSLKYVNCAGMDDCRSKVSAAWNMVILTGSRGGVIRSFHNYGLPVRL